MIDSHIHILPGIDDGARDLNMALKMAQVAVSDGINTLICTPHDLNGAYRNDRNKVINCISQFDLALKDKNIPLDILPGAELHFAPEIASKVLEGDALTMADNGTYVLLEFPRISIPFGAENVIETLLYNKITPIIAHPERNPQIVSEQLLEEWINWGCKAQLTAMSVTGEFSNNIQQTCKTWCQQGLIHLVASDAHRPKGRSPKLAMAKEILDSWLGEKSAEILTLTNPQQIINDLELITIEPVTSKSKKKGFFGFLKG